MFVCCCGGWELPPEWRKMSTYNPQFSSLCVPPLKWFLRMRMQLSNKACLAHKTLNPTKKRSYKKRAVLLSTQVIAQMFCWLWHWVDQKSTSVLFIALIWCSDIQMCAWIQSQDRRSFLKDPWTSYLKKKKLNMAFRIKHWFLKQKLTFLFHVLQMQE